MSVRAERGANGRLTTVGLVDYDLGNLPSVTKAVERLGVQVVRIEQAKDFERDLDALILPGVGHFGAGARNLASRGFTEPLRAWTKPLLGICVGLQLFFERSEEDPDARGLGILPGAVRRLKPDGLKVPHMGWNVVTATPRAEILRSIDGRRAYFVHSFYPDTPEPAATTEYGERFAVAVEAGHVTGVQFHPEKSADVGRVFLEAWLGA